MLDINHIFKAALDINHIFKEPDHPWVRNRVNIIFRLANLCKRNNIHYINYKNLFDTTSIKESPTEKIISWLFYDLQCDPDGWKIIDEVCGRENKKIWFITDNIIDSTVYQFKNIQIKSYHKLLGMSYYGETISDKPPTKLYNCFVQRCESIRQSWFYFLHLNNLLDKGHVSYLLWQMDDYSKHRGTELFNFIHYNFKLDQLEQFDRAFKELTPVVPYKNFSDDVELTKLIADSKYSLVLETFATDDVGAWCVTEKSMRSLQSSSITLGFCQKHTFKKLSELGIEVDDFLKHIDGLEWVDRQQALLKILVEDSIDIDTTFKHDQCKHNADLLLNWKKQYEKNDFFDSLFDEIKAA